MSIERKFVPIPEANTNRLRTSIGLPYHLEKQIGLNVSSIEKLAQIAGVAKIKIGMETAGGGPKVVGITSGGQAIGRFSMTAMQNPYSFENNIDYPSSSPGTLWSYLEINLREQEAIILMESQNKDIKNPENWANLIDNAFKKGLTLSGVENLLKRHPLLYFVQMLSLYPIISGFTDKDPRTLVLYTLWKTVDLLSNVSSSGFENKGSGYRWSFAFFGGLEIDRMIVFLSGMSMARVAKKILVPATT